MKKEEIKDWAENPVTEHLLKLVEDYIKSFESIGMDAFHPYEPQKTQEVMAGLNATIDTWECAADLLRGEWDLVIEDEDEDE